MWRWVAGETQGTPLQRYIPTNIYIHVEGESDRNLPVRPAFSRKWIQRQPKWSNVRLPVLLGDSRTEYEANQGTLKIEANIEDNIS